MPLLSQDYGHEMAKKVKQSLGGSFAKHFKFATYPVDNFGLATIYRGDGTEVCATWTCLGGDEVTPSSATDLLELKTTTGTKYADPGEGGALQLSDNENSDYAVTFILPKILQVLKVTTKFDKTKDVTSGLILGPVTKRKLILNSMNARFASLP